MIALNQRLECRPSRWNIGDHDSGEGLAHGGLKGLFPTSVNID
jgi:hypothetical protein